MYTLDRDDFLLFTPVPAQRVTASGWSSDVQHAFIAALAKCGVVSAAARSVGRAPRSAWMLRKRPGAEGFAAAWDAALDEGRMRAVDAATARLLNPVSTPIFYGGRQVGVRVENKDALLYMALRAMTDRRNDITYG